MKTITLPTFQEFLMTEGYFGPRMDRLVQHGYITKDEQDELDALYTRDSHKAVRELKRTYNTRVLPKFADKLSKFKFIHGGSLESLASTLKMPEICVFGCAATAPNKTMWGGGVNAIVTGKPTLAGLNDMQTNQYMKRIGTRSIRRTDYGNNLLLTPEDFDSVLANGGGEFLLANHKVKSFFIDIDHIKKKLTPGHTGADVASYGKTPDQATDLFYSIVNSAGNPPVTDTTGNNLSKEQTRAIFALKAS